MYKIRNTCVGCHNCYCECPMQAIYWSVNKYEIDPDRCVECGLCARECHTASIYNDSFDYSVEPHEKITHEADVVVCGAGTGLVGAVRAAQQGKKVIVLEKAEKVGGNTDYAHGYFPIYTKWHEEAGMEDVREKAIVHYQEITDYELEEDILRTAVYSPGEFFDWLCTLDDVHQAYQLVNLGDIDAKGPIYGPGLLDFKVRILRNLNNRDDAIGPGWGGTYVIETMLKTIREQHLPVEIYLEHAAKHLLLDDTGKIAGVIAEDPGGITEIHAPTVILATGGFGRSDEKLKEFAPWFFEGETPFHRFSVKTDTGDGIDMLRELGVEPNPERMFISHFGPKHHPYSNILADLALEPEVLQINMDGKRWCCETYGRTDLYALTQRIDHQPKQISWAIQSRDNYALIANHFMTDPAFINKWNMYETWESELLGEASLPHHPCIAADTLDELAEMMGVPAQTLKETVEQYNAYCAKKEDADYGKEAEFLIPVSETGPYYAILGQRFSEAAMGGLTVDGECRVLRNDGTFIPGLYGVGDATSAMHRKDKMAVISELTWAVASSFKSGNNAVAYVDALQGGEAICG